MLFQMQHWRKATTSLVQRISFHNRLLGDSGLRKSATKSAFRVDIISLHPGQCNHSHEAIQEVPKQRRQVVPSVVLHVRSLNARANREHSRQEARDGRRSAVVQSIERESKSGRIDGHEDMVDRPQWAELRDRDDLGAGESCVLFWGRDDAVGLRWILAGWEDMRTDQTYLRPDGGRGNLCAEVTSVECLVVVAAFALLPERGLAVDQVTNAGKVADGEVDAVEIWCESDEGSGDTASTWPELQSPGKPS